MNGYLLDTNIISELRVARRADEKVAAWSRVHRSDVYLSVVTLAEIGKGIALLQRRDPQQAEIFRRWLDHLQNTFGRTGHILPLRTEEALIWGEFMAIRTLPAVDAFLAATAKARDLVLVTRNEKDFADLPITVENPFR